MSIFTVCWFALGVGCRSTGGEQTLLGRWEDTDLSKTEHVSQFAKAVLIFRSDGTAVSYMVDRKGNEIQREVEPYHILGDILQFGEGSDRYRFVIKGNALFLTVAKSLNAEDIGLPLEYRRKE